MKRFIVIVTAVCLLCSLCLFTHAESANGVVAVEEGTPSYENATETKSEPLTQSPDTDSASEDDTLDFTAYFNKYVLPILTGLGTALTVMSPFIILIIRSIIEKNQLKGLYTEKAQANEMLQKLVDENNISAVVEQFLPVIEQAIRQGVLEDLKLDPAAYADLKAQLDLLSAQLTSLTLGATNAWAQSPAAVACLASSPTASVVVQQAEYIKRLEDAIRLSKGEEAEETINAIKEG